MQAGEFAERSLLLLSANVRSFIMLKFRMEINIAPSDPENQKIVQWRLDDYRDA